MSASPSIYRNAPGARAERSAGAKPEGYRMFVRMMPFVHRVKRSSHVGMDRDIARVHREAVAQLIRGLIKKLARYSTKSA
jgi:hypothetical protein